LSTLNTLQVLAGISRHQLTVAVPWVTISMDDDG
jgi:hypothetical protein